MATDAHDGEKGQLRLGPARLGVEELASSRLFTRLVKALLEPGRRVIVMAEIRKFGLWLMSTSILFALSDCRGCNFTHRRIKGPDLPSFIPSLSLLRAGLKGGPQVA